MTQHIQKLVMGLFVSAFLIVAFNIDTQAQQLNTVWERTTLANDLPTWFQAGSVRGIAHGTVGGNERIYAVNRADSRLEVFNPVNGTQVTLGTAFDLSGLSGGTFAMNDVEISDDGVVFVGNLSSNESNPFRLYWWTSEGGAFADSLTLAVPYRLGDKFSVVGSVADNTAEIWMPAASSNPGIVYVATTSDQGASWNIETITLSGDNTSIPGNEDVAPLAVGRNSDFYVAGNGSSPKRYTSTGAYVANSQFGAAMYTGSRNGLQAFTLDSVNHLAVYTYRVDGDDTGNKTGRVYVYDISDPATPVTVGESPLMGSDTDTFSSIHGEAQVRINSNGTYNVFALDGVNGLAAYTNAEQEVAENIYFSEYIEGSSNNKALEIYNASITEVSLSSYQIAQSSNGGGWEFFFSFADGGSIFPDETYVLITDQVDASLFAAENADEVLGFPSPIHFNGNDARALIHIDPAYGDTTFLDVFGDPNSDVNWDVAGVAGATAEHTLLRKVAVTAGNPTPLASFGTGEESSEWIVNAQNDFSNLGEPTPAGEALAGEYYIPQGSNAQGFDSLAAAIDVLNEFGLSGATTFYIDADLQENTQLRINRGDLTETNSLLIKPAPGKSVTISTNDLRIVDAGYITIDGSNEPGGNTQDLTIQKSGSGGGLLGLLSATYNVTIKNLNITYADALGADTYAVLINRRESGDASGRAENVTFENVKIGTADSPFNDAFWLFGDTVNPDFFHLNVSFLNNELHVGRSAVRTQTHTNTNFSGNIVKAYGNGTGENPVFNLNTPIESFTFTNNEISFVSTGGTEARTFIGLNATNSLVETVDISNNTFTTGEFSGEGTEHSFYGFMHAGASSTADFQIFHNSFLFTETGQSGTHASIGQTETAAAGASVNAANNIFVNNRDAANSYTYEWGSAGITADYNNVVVTGDAAVASIGDTRYTTLNAWTDSTGNDQSSTGVDVTFVSATDLRLAGSSIGDNNLAGIPLASVVTDIDGNLRSETAPYKGAFEADVELNAGVQIGTFALTSPEDGFSLNLTGDVTTEVVISWETPTAPDTVVYTWHADSVGGDFSDPLVSIPSDDGGSATTLTLTYQQIDDVVADLGVAEGGNIDLIWTVTAEAGETVRFADASFDLNIARNLSVSNETDDRPREFSLSQNYPNPFNPTSNIQFTVPQATDVKLEVFNINGQLVRTLVNSRMSAGEHTVQFNASDLASGIYIYRIIAGNFVQTKKMTLIK